MNIAPYLFFLKILISLFRFPLNRTIKKTILYRIKYPSLVLYSPLCKS